jgi:Uma2 family endonuclease
MFVATDTKRWTLDELHSLPDDGNKYEVVRGELFVTPAPSGQHESILAALSSLLTPYVVANKRGLVYHPRAVLRFEDSEVEPDLMVRQPWRTVNTDWSTAPLPSLIVEVLSPSTRNRDRKEKRTLYADARIVEYWIVDPERKTVTVIARNEMERTVRDTLVWYPSGAVEPLEISLSEIFIDSD